GTTRYAVLLRGTERGADPAALDGAALVFRQPAPDAGVLVAVQGPAQALVERVASPADGFGLVDLEQGGTRGADREEQLGIFVTAGSPVAPVHASRPSVGAQPGWPSSVVIPNPDSAHFVNSFTN